jgi:hypothetical protein
MACNCKNSTLAAIKQKRKIFFFFANLNVKMVVSINRIQSSRVQVKSSKIPLGEIKLQTNFCGFFSLLRYGVTRSLAFSYLIFSLNHFSAQHFFNLGDVSPESLILVTSPLQKSLLLSTLSYKKIHTKART